MDGSSLWTLHPSLAHLLADLPVAVLVVDPAHRVALVSAGCAARFEVAVGDELDAFWSRCGVGDRAALSVAAREQVARAEALGEADAVSGQMILRGRDGAARTFQSHLAMLHHHAVWIFRTDTYGDARSASVAELERRVQELERQVMTDRLTGAWARRYLDEVLPAELERARRYQQPLSLAIVDIDLFKRVNDAHGHAVGDLVLVEVARRLKSSVRSGDALVRWGGEEFVVLAPTTSLAGAATLGERLRRAVAAATIGDVGRITVSVGVAEHLGNETAEEWFARADAALYAAKQGGRDRVARADGTAYPDWDGLGSAPAVRLAWSDRFACGEPVIDAEHEQLFRMANSLLAVAFEPGADATEVSRRLDALIEHVAEHFAHEEAALAAAKYHGLDGHRRLHRELIERARALAAASREHALSPWRLVEFVARDVVADHIMKADRSFFRMFEPKKSP